MKDRRAFEHILNNTFIPSNNPRDMNNQLIGALHDEAHKGLPRKLYRYQRCDDLRFDAFDKNQIWISTARSMNDGFDTRIFINKDEIRKEISKNVLPDKSLQEFKDLALEASKIIPGIDVVKANKIQEDTFKQIKEDYRAILTSDMMTFLEVIPDEFQRMLKICCFCERNDLSTMWGQYADSEKGFCLEYNSRSLLKVASPNKYGRSCQLLPVIYSDRRYLVPTDYIMSILKYRSLKSALISSGYYQCYPDVAAALLNDNCIIPDELVPIKASLHKSDEWSREEEWRLFCTSNDDIEFQNAEHGCCIVKPSAVYLGRRISSINSKILISLAQEKEIPVYKMQLDEESPTYNMKPIQIG